MQSFVNSNLFPFLLVLLISTLFSSTAETTEATTTAPQGIDSITTTCPSSSEPARPCPGGTAEDDDDSAATSYCELFPNSGQGPFYIPNQKIRSNITEGKVGVAVNLTLIVRDIANCQPIPHVPIDIWHSDALGYYSGYLSYYKDGKLSGLSGSHVDPTDDEEFLRGLQYTDTDGKVIFQTIFPGWYSGRTNHYHIELRHAGVQYPGHLFFTEEATAGVAKEFPYTKNKNIKVKNYEDGGYVHDGGEQTTLKFTGNPKSGLQATLVLGIRG